jgi:hypothetical protein
MEPLKITRMPSPISGFEGSETSQAVILEPFGDVSIEVLVAKVAELTGISPQVLSGKFISTQLTREAAMVLAPLAQIQPLRRKSLL